MGSKQAFIKADKQRKLELSMYDGASQIHDTMSLITDNLVDAIVKSRAGGLESERLHKFIRALLESNRNWASEMKTYISGAGKEISRPSHRSFKRNLLCYNLI